MFDVNKTNLSESITRTKEIMKSELRRVSSVVSEDILNKISMENHISSNPSHHERTRDSILSYSFIDKNIKSDMNVRRKVLKKRTTQRKKTSSQPKKDMNKETIYERSVKLKAMHEKKVETKKAFINLHQISQMKSHPEISEMSKKILLKKKEKDDMGSLPLHMRINQIRENKEKKLKALCSKVNQCENQSKLKITMKSNSCNFDNWITMNEVWKHNHEAKLSYLKKEYEELEEMEEGCVFMPIIDQKSEQIVQLRNKERNKSCFDILYLKHYETKAKLEKKRNSSLPSFKPIINNKSKILAKDRYNYSIPLKTPMVDPLNLSCEDINEKQHPENSLHKKSKSQCELTSNSLIELNPNSTLYKINVYNDSSWKCPVASVGTTKMNEKFIMSTLTKFWK